MVKKDEKKSRIAELQKLIQHHAKLYHELDAPEITDETYDSLIRELRTLSGSNDRTPSVGKRVGGTASSAFTKVRHKVRQYSFSNVFNAEELREWDERAHRVLRDSDIHASCTYVAEHKIDGLKVILEYERGVLVRAATRGDGVVGEDVTHTVSTIADIPKKLTRPVDITCVGEVWLSEKELARINKGREKNGEALFVNPRNAAAGSLRQLDPNVTKARKLESFIYDIDTYDPGSGKGTPPQSQWDELTLLATLGFHTNPHSAECKSIDDVVSYYDIWCKKKDTLPYNVDGVVVKVDAIDLQRALGHTAKAPRFGTAFKFPSVEATTVVEDIQLQVGRTGAITPVAHLTPVFIDGSTVSRATLHNEDQIKKLDIRIGDTVILHKAGDIIPEITGVILELRPKNTKPYRFPKKVDGCGGDGSIERVPGESAYRCVTLESDFLHRQRLYYFVSKGALNVDGVGPRIIDLLLDHNLISEHYDLFTLEAGDLKDLPSFKEKAAENVVSAIATAKTVPLHRLLIGLSIEHVGEETARLIAEHFGSLEAIRDASVEEMAQIHGVGGTVAESLHAWFRIPKNTSMLEKVLPYLTVEEPKKRATQTPLSNATVVFTGSLESMTRDEAKDRARSAGAQVSSSISKNTDYVIVGSEAGSKEEKARALGVTILTEQEFLKMVS